MALDPNAIASEWMQRASDENSSSKYANKAAAAAQKWKDQASKAQGAYAENTQASIQRGDYARGIAKATADDYAKGVQGKGVQNRINGILAGGQDKYARNVAPYLAEIDRVVPTLPARRANGMDNLINRAGPIVQRLQALKRGGGGGGQVSAAPSTSTYSGYRRY